MTAPKPTPGPWQALGPAESEAEAGRHRYYVSRIPGVPDVPPEKFYIAIMHCGDEQRDAADARLIAAAPDLLAALEAVVFAAKAEGLHEARGWKQLVPECEAILRKARG